MSSLFAEAFVGAPLKLPWSFRYAGRPATTPRRMRTFTLSPQARSLESYREGKHFEQEREKRRAVGRKSARQSEQLPDLLQKGGAAKPPKPAVALVTAMSLMNVASAETCSFLIRSGCVRVHGEVASLPKVKINRFEDVVVVNGKEYGPLESVLEAERALKESNVEDVIDQNLLPRSQRDFKSSAKRSTGTDPVKKYNRGVDGGFYSTRRYQSGK